MTCSKPPRATRDRTGRTRAGLLAVVAAIAAVGYQLVGSSSSTAASLIEVLRGQHRTPLGKPHGPLPDALGKADGAVPEGTSVFDDGVPGVAKVDPELLGALREAATDASDDGVEFVVDSGWRSAAYQEHLVEDAISKYGSEEEAARWVATPHTSAHVSGDAVDIGPSEAADWLSENGAEYGLCQIYANEPWHYELRPEAVTQGCPAMYADPTDDPRMQR
jgi:zinc D-Ala-D-Ala carboxypeptidase